MRLRGVLLGGVVALLFAGPAHAVLLVTAQGQPVGGQWQRWANEAKVPTVRRLVLLVNDPSACGGSLACSEGAPWGATPNLPPWTAVSSGPMARYELYFELGHQFDWQTLTWPDRSWFARHWSIETPTGRGVERWHWENSAYGLSLGGEDGLEVAFAGLYADCAMGEDDKGALLVPFEPEGVAGPTVASNINVCRYLPRRGGPRT